MGALARIVGRCVDGVGDESGCVGLHSGDHVCVLFHREGGVFVSETLGDDLDWHSGLEGDGGMGVSDVVETDPREPR